MTEEECFLLKIRTNPADDTVRLVYADWLDEHAATVPCPRCNEKGEVPDETPVFYEGVESSLKRWPKKCMACRGTGIVSDGRRERAEFIRVQIELAKIDREYMPAHDHRRPGCPACKMLRKRQRFWNTEQKAGRGIRDVWPWPFKTPGGHGIESRWSRGFVSAITLTAAAFLGTGGSPGIAEELFAAHPIERVTFPGVVRGGTLFRNSSGGGGVSPDLTREQWEMLGLGRCDSRRPDCVGAGTHAHMTEDEFSAACVRLGRERAGLPDLTPVPTPDRPF